MRGLGYPIGEASRTSGIKVPTIYDAADLKRLTFIRHARELGFDVEAIRTLLSLQDEPAQSCAAADAIAKARLTEVEARIARLTALRAELEERVAQCARGRIDACRVVETLADGGHVPGRLADF